MRTRTAGIAIVALALCALGACFYSVGWSPDSRHVIFSIPDTADEGAIVRLTMSDTEGKAERSVAAITPDRGRLGPASWSPDGRWIAFFRFETAALGVAPGQAEPPLTASLVLQDAEKGQERAVVAGPVAKNSLSMEGNSAMAPQWAADSKRMLIFSLDQDKPGVAVLGLDGRVLSRVPLDEETVQRSVSLSPDGRTLLLARAAKAPEGGAGPHTLVLVDLATGRERALGEVTGEPAARPPWTPDSASVVVGVQVKGDAQRSEVWRFPVDGAPAQVLWSKDQAAVMFVTLAAQTGRTAVEYHVNKGGGDYVGIDLVSADGAQVVPLHFGPGWFGSGISPDGRWVAVGVPMGEKPQAFVGAILPSDGGAPRLHVPEGQDRVEAAAAFTTGRLEMALTAAEGEGVREALRDPTEPSAKARLARADALLAKIAEAHKEPVFQEAAAWARVRLAVEAAAGAAPQEAAELLEEARGRLEAFAGAHPGHPTLPGLAKGIQEASAPPAEGGP